MGLDLSVIVVTHNTRELLRTCLESVRAKTARARYEIIVVDNASTDGTRQMLEREFPDVAAVYRAEPHRFAAAANAGIARAAGRYLALLNSDTELDNNALDRMIEFLDNHPDCGVAGCRLSNPDGSLQLSCRRFPGYLTALFNRYSLLTRLFPENSYSQAYLMTAASHDADRRVDWVSGACLFARADAVQRVGALDERLLFSTEDVDWCKRMWEAGWSVWYHPGAVVRHAIGSTATKFPYRVTLLRHISMLRYYRKHLSQEVLVLDAAVCLGLVARALLLGFRQALLGRGPK